MVALGPFKGTMAFWKDLKDSDRRLHLAELSLGPAHSPGDEGLLRMAGPVLAGSDIPWMGLGEFPVILLS